LINGELHGVFVHNAEEQRSRVPEDPLHRSGNAENPGIRLALDLHRVISVWCAAATGRADKRAREVEAVVGLMRHLRRRTEHADHILSEILRAGSLVVICRDSSRITHAPVSLPSVVCIRGVKSASSTET